MGWPLLEVVIALWCLAAHARAAETAPAAVASDGDTIVWILAGIFVFFVIVGVFTWRLIKDERKRQDKPPA
jgi:hypothetical protein